MLKNAIMIAAVPLIAMLTSHTAFAAPDCERLQTLQQIDDGLSSVDKETRFRAQTCGLSSQDRFARGLVIQKLLSGGRLDFVIGNAPGDAKSAEVAATIYPAFANNVKWSDDQKHFVGYDSGNNAVAGSMIADTMSVVLTLRTDKSFASCQSRLTLNEARDAMTGPLICANLPGRFTLQIDL